MPKIKTHRAAAKRFRKTASGKYKAGHANKSHILTKKSTKRKRNLRGTNMVRLPQVALPLGRLLGEDVALVGVAALVLAGSGLPEALGRRPIGLDLGHWESLRNLLNWSRRQLGLAASPRFPSCLSR